MKGIVDFLIARLGERSTWLGVCTLLSVVGVKVFASPEFANQFAGAGLAIVGVVAVLLKDRPQ
jgi:hypothetical protein